MLRKGRGKKTYFKDQQLFSVSKKGRTDAETLNFKIISMRTKDLKEILNNPGSDILSLSFAKEELDRRNFNQKNKIGTQKHRSKLDKQYPEHKNLLKQWKRKPSKKRS
jgi:hypothetical protein